MAAFDEWARRLANAWRQLTGADLSPGKDEREGAASDPLCSGRADRARADRLERGLPNALLEAFSDEALEAGDARFVGRAAELQRLAAAVAAWRGGRPAMVAVTAPQGAGLSSFLRRTQAFMQEGEVLVRHTLAGRPRSAEQVLEDCARLFDLEAGDAALETLVARINEAPPRVVVLDDGHFLACRVMGATEAIRSFGTLMVATQERHLWVLGCHRYAWQRLDYVHQAKRFFADVIQLGLLDRQELGEALAARFAAAAVPAPALGDERIAELQRLSRGVPALAFHHLLRALSPEGEALRLEPLVPFDFAALKQLAPVEMMSLAEVAVHGRLSAADHQALLRSADADSRMLLERLSGQCLLERVAVEGEDVAYRLPPLHADAITVHLANANFLY